MIRLLRLPLLAAALLVAGTAGLHPPLAGAQEPKDAPKAGELPRGAKLRLGGSRLMFRAQPYVALLPPDYKTLVTPVTGGELRKFDLVTGDPLDKDKAGTGTGGGQVVVSGDAKRYVSVATGILTIRAADTGKAIQQIKPLPQFSTTFTSGVPAVSLSHDGKVLAQGGTSVGAKGAVVVWDVDKGESLFQAGLQHNGPPIPAISPDGKYLATRPYQAFFGGGKDDAGPKVTVWEVDGGKELFNIRPTGSGPQVTAMAYSPDGGLVAVACGDGPIDVWDVKAARVKHVLFGRTGQGLRAAFSPDGKTLAAVATDGTVQRWTVADGTLVGTTDGPAALPLNAAQGLAFVGNDRVVAWGAVGQSPVAWEAPSGKLLTTLPEHTTGIRSVGFAAGGKEIITSGQDSRVVRWDAATGKPLGLIELRPSRGLVAPGNRLVVNVSPDGTRAVTMATPNAVFDLANGTEEFVLPRGPTFNSSIYSLLAPDLTRVVTVSVPIDQKRTGTCIVWDVVGRQKLAEFELAAASGTIPAAAFSPDGSRMVTAVVAPNPDGGPQLLRVTGWDLKTGKKLGEFEDMNSRGAPFVAAASNSFAVVATTAGRLRAYDYETGRGGDEFEAAGNRVDASGPIVFTPDGKRFLIGHMTEPGVYGVRVHDWPSGRVLHTFTGHTGPVTALVFSPDGRTLASGSQDSTVLVWDIGVAK